MQAQGWVPRAEALTVRLAMVVGALEGQQPDDRLEGVVAAG